MIGHHAQKDGNASANRIIDNPLSQNPGMPMVQVFLKTTLKSLVYHLET